MYAVKTGKEGEGTGSLSSIFGDGGCPAEMKLDVTFHFCDDLLSGTGTARAVGMIVGA